MSLQSLLTGVGGTAAGPAGGAVGNILGGILGSVLRDGNPNDWKGWKALDAKHGLPVHSNMLIWVKEDGDSIKNEARNIISYLNEYGFDGVIGYNSWHARYFGISDIAKKLERAGFKTEASALVEKYNSTIGGFSDSSIDTKSILPSSGIPDFLTTLLSGSNKSDVVDNKANKNASVSFIFIAILALLFYSFLKNVRNDF